MSHIVTVITAEGTHIIHAPDGANLRHVLLEAGHSPYTSLTRRLNCGGRGLCATCGVWVSDDAPPARHWHDRAAAAFGYPRLSCQITVDRDMTVEMVDKWVWGPRAPGRRAAAPPQDHQTSE